MKKRMISAIICIFLLGVAFAPAALASTLKYGDSGSQVNQAQVRLANVGFYKDKVDGKFGFSSYQAVLGFQNVNGLKVDGVIGEKTSTRLYSANALDVNGNIAGGTYYLRLQYGSEGPAVKTVQGNLRNLGYYLDDVEGKFGWSTFQAVKAFQNDNGLQVDGIVGPVTWAKLVSGIVLPPPPPPPPSPAVMPAYLIYGQQSVFVSQMQQRLKDLDYEPGAIDGKFGWTTFLAVKAFQRVNGLKVDGIAGPQTQAVLFGASPKKAGEAPAKSYVNLKYGAKGTAVKNVQQRLKDLGYNPGAIDGSFGWDTYVAVHEFQKANSLPVDGIVGDSTWMKLFSPSAVGP